MPLKLVIGNKAYSSWSLRPWLLMRVLDIPFDEVVVPLDRDGTGETIRRYSSAGKVPILIDGDVTVWDSLAIVEYLAETHPAVWPTDRTARAVARALAAEMHSGFSPLRRAMPMNMRRDPKPLAHDPDSEADIAANVARIEVIWEETRRRYGAVGSFLFGAFCAADAMFAPIVNRFHAYAVETGPDARGYMDAIAALPAWRDWQAGADAEGWRIEKFERL